MLHQVSAIAILSVLLAIALAACGSTTRHSSSSGHENKQLALAQCMRAHGVTDFPDPGSRGGFTVVMSPGSSTVSIDGTNFSGPTFASAEKACQLFGGRTGPGPISETQKLRLVNFARCMRMHGVPSWADPTFPPGGGIEGGGPPNPADANSPAAQKAAQTCNRLVGL